MYNSCSKISHDQEFYRYMACAQRDTQNIHPLCSYSCFPSAAAA